LEGLTISENRFGVDAELIAKFARHRCRINEVGIAYNARTYAQGKKVRWKDGLRAIYVILKYGLLDRARSFSKRNNRQVEILKTLKARDAEIQKADTY